jgi:two-component system sensor histidine kinase CpxA
MGVTVAGDRVQIAVRDYGPGVPEADLARLGTPFFRVDDGRDAATGGSGLGLAIARRGIECHGGEWHLANAQPGLRVTMVVRGMASEPGSG